MTPLRIAIAARYCERHTIKQILDAQLSELPVQLTASWLTCTEEHDGDLTDEQAKHRVLQNMQEIANAHALLYFPSWTMDEYGDNWIPVYSPGRLIDYGIAMALGLDLIIVGKPEPSMYFRGVTACTPETLRETVKRVLKLESYYGAAKIEG